MRDDYKISKPTTPLNLSLENDVIETLQTMEKYTKLSASEIVNTAVKRFISQHKDFLPADYSPKKNAS